MSEEQQFYGPPAELPDKSEIAGLVAAAMPFICNFTTTSTWNGQIVSQTDYAAIALGIVAILIGLSTIRLWSKTPPADLMKRRALFAVIMVLGAFQLARGLGLFV